MTNVRRFVMITFAVLIAPGCLVVSVHPTHDREALVWDPALLGDWVSADDNSSLKIERGEWQSYRLHYVHPIETGDLTGFLTTLGRVRYLDVTPAKGEDHGSFLVPVHATVRVTLAVDRLELTALSYDWFFDRIKSRTAVPGLQFVLDEKENALIVSPTAAVRAWIARQPPEGRMFSASAIFTRKPGA
jgi:hypothetical protein